MNLSEQTLAMIDCLAEDLVAADVNLLAELIKIRKKHLSQELVAERMGVSQPTVASFERYDANPTLATIRRYALAIGASVQHIVVDRARGYSQAEARHSAHTSAPWPAAPPVSWNLAPIRRVVRTARILEDA